MTKHTEILIQSVPDYLLDQVRLTGRDVSGNPAVVLDDVDGVPLRCCLRDARLGEKCLLFGYEPPLPANSSPYREIGAVYAHADPCGGPVERDAGPVPWVGRPQVLRAYDARGWIHPATTTHDGTDPLTALSRVLAEPGVVEVHSRNIAYGCFMFTATRSAA